MEFSTVNPGSLIAEFYPPRTRYIWSPIDHENPAWQEVVNKLTRTFGPAAKMQQGKDVDGYKNPISLPYAVIPDGYDHPDLWWTWEAEHGWNWTPDLYLTNEEQFIYCSLAFPDVSIQVRR